ncbi:hypothetical protein DFJ74DRAFT_679423 [Hyaloraphidium curvatum]|nr:hypothetical protein DFJ74DRAFT_679423 [Hyaloraphidium curvatum]
MFPQTWHAWSSRMGVNAGFAAPSASTMIPSFASTMAGSRSDASETTTFQGLKGVLRDMGKTMARQRMASNLSATLTGEPRSTLSNPTRTPVRPRGEIVTMDKGVEPSFAWQEASADARPGSRSPTVPASRTDAVHISSPRGTPGANWRAASSSHARSASP